MDMTFSVPFSSGMTEEYLMDLCARHKCLFLSRIGASLTGKPLYSVRAGTGKAYHLFVGCHHGSEHITSQLLLKFLSDCACAFEGDGRLFGFDIKSIFSARSLFVIPMLNPDGADLSLGYFPREHPLYPRLVSQNPRGRDFTFWQANARGVDLNHNYNAGFDECRKLEHKAGIYSGGPTRYGGIHPESEPETAALCALTRLISQKLRTAVALHSQGEEIYYDFLGDAPEGALMLAECFSRVSGYTVSKPDGIASYGGFKDWVILEYGIPAFTIECGRGKNPLPQNDFDGIYEKIAPILLTDASFI